MSGIAEGRMCLFSAAERDVVLLNAGFVSKLADWNEENSIRQFWVMLYAFAPGACCVSGKNSYPLTPDKIILIPPGTVYSGKSNFTVPYLFVWFMAGAPFDFPETRILEIPAAPYLRELELVIKQDSRTHLRLNNLVGRILLDIPENFFASERKCYSPAMAKAVDFIMKKSGIASNETVARYLNISVSRFLHLFKTETGMSPQRYCLKLRMSIAADNLLRGMSVEQTAELGGFANRFHFSREFRKHYGLAPGKWLKQSGQDGEGCSGNF